MSPPPSPDLDQECEDLSAEDAVNRLPDLDEETGLYVRYWERDWGTDHFFARRVAPMNHKLPFETISGTNGMPVRYPTLGVVESIKTDATEYICEAPVKRMPNWGDESLVISCDACSRAARIDDVTYTNSRYYHDACAPTIEADEN